MTQSLHGARVAVLDTETNWDDEVMSLGIAIAGASSFYLEKVAYYIFPSAARRGGLFEAMLSLYGDRACRLERAEGMAALDALLRRYGVRSVFAYNARFDAARLPELGGYQWFDIMRIAAYRQYNPHIPPGADCCVSGRLRRGFGVEPILRMITADDAYRETHNALRDALDELKIMQLLGLPLEAYGPARIR